MGGIGNNQQWRVTAVLRAFDRLSPPVSGSVPSSRLGWSAQLSLTADEISPPDQWRRFHHPGAPRRLRPGRAIDPSRRIGEMRGWKDPAP